jgi:hypothetical protein
MNARILDFVALIIVLALIAGLAGSANAQTGQTQTNIGESFFKAGTLSPVKKFPTSELLVPVPSIFDPSEEDSILILCQVQVFKLTTGVQNARGRFRAELVLIDNRTGQAERFFVAGGRFKTSRQGTTSFNFKLLAERIADGFGSGDVSAWLYTRIDFTNRKRATDTFFQCRAEDKT